MNKKELKQEIFRQSSAITELCKKIAMLENQIDSVKKDISVHEDNYHATDEPLFIYFHVIKEDVNAHPLSRQISLLYRLIDIDKVEMDGVKFYQATYEQKDSFGTNTIKKFKKFEDKEVNNG